MPGFEADDVIATLTRARARPAGMEVVICSSDKDLMQLCDDDVTMLDTMKNRRLGPAEVKEKFGVAPEQVGDVLALMGDSIDNVPGVDGIGPKTAAELINKFGSLDGALRARRARSRASAARRWSAARELVRTSRELVALRDDVPLPKTLAELHRVEPDRDQLLRAVPRAGVLAPGRGAERRQHRGSRRWSPAEHAPWRRPRGGRPRRRAGAEARVDDAVAVDRSAAPVVVVARRRSAARVITDVAALQALAARDRRRRRGRRWP